MRATGRFDGYLAAAMRADLGCGGGGRFFGGFFLADLVEIVHHLDDEEQYDRDDEEVDDCHQERAVFQFNTEEANSQCGEVLLRDQTDDRRDDVVDQGVDDALEGSTDHNTDRHIDDVTAIDKFLEFC